MEFLTVKFKIMNTFKKQYDDLNQYVLDRFNEIVNTNSKFIFADEEDENEIESAPTIYYLDGCAEPKEVYLINVDRTALLVADIEDPYDTSTIGFNDLDGLYYKIMVVDLLELEIAENN